MERINPELYENAFGARDPFMAEAIREAYSGVVRGHGGPFGSVVVRDGEIIGRGHNMVLAEHDSTAHGEITAIRDAEKRLNSHDLTGCVLYTTGEPCPMCLFACLWANVEKIFYGCTIEDNSAIGFRDAELDRLTVDREELGDRLECVDRDACLALFAEYSATEHETY